MGESTCRCHMYDSPQDEWYERNHHPHGSREECRAELIKKMNDNWDNLFTQTRPCFESEGNKFWYSDATCKEAVAFKKTQGFFNAHYDKSIYPLIDLNGGTNCLSRFWLNKDKFKLYVVNGFIIGFWIIFFHFYHPFMGYCQFR